MNLGPHTSGQRPSRRQDGGATLYLSVEIAKLIPPSQRFIAELTEDGILFRRLPSADGLELPSWVAERV